MKLEGAGVWVEMWVAAQSTHPTGVILILGELLGGPLASGLKQIVQQAFQRNCGWATSGPRLCYHSPWRTDRAQRFRLR